MSAQPQPITPDRAPRPLLGPAFGRDHAVAWAAGCIFGLILGTALGIWIGAEARLTIGDAPAPESRSAPGP